MSSGKAHKAVRVVQGVALGWLLLHVAVLVLFQIPAVQTRTAKAVSGALRQKIDGDISIGSISLVLFNRVTLRDVTVTGHGAPPPWCDSSRFSNPGDTLAHIGKLSASFSLKDIISGRPGVRRIVLDDGWFYLLTEDTLRGTNLSRIFRLPPPDPTREHKVFPDLFAGDIKLRGGRVTIGNPFIPGHEGTSFPDGQMQYDNIRVRDINAHFRNLKTTDGEVSCHIDHISAHEACGAGIELMTGDFHLGPRGSGMDDMYLKDMNGSVIEADHLRFIYSSKEEVADWVNSVVMDVSFRPSVFNFNSIRYFVPTMAVNRLPVDIDGGHVVGPVSDMDIDDLQVSLPGGRTSAAVSAVLRGIPDMPGTWLEGTVSDRTCTADLERIASLWSGSAAGGGLSRVAAGETIRQRLSVRGPFRDLSVRGSLSLGHGLLSHQGGISLFTPAGFSITGQVEADSLNLGHILGSDVFGEADFRLKGELSAGSRLSADLEYLQIERLGVKGYEYRDVLLEGGLSDTAGSLYAVSRDTSFRFEMNADAEFEEDDRSGRYTLSLSVPYADLGAANLVDVVEKSEISGLKVNSSAVYDGDDNAVGYLKMSGLSYTNDNGSITMDSLVIDSSYDRGRYSVKLRSPFASASYSGSDALLGSVSRFRDMVIGRQFGDVFGGGDAPQTGQKGNDTLHLEAYDCWRLSRVLASGIYISEGTTLDMTLSESDSLDLTVSSPRIAMKKNYIKDLSLKADNPDSSLRVRIHGSEIKSGQLCLKDDAVDILASSGVIRVGGRFLNSKMEPDKSMSIDSDIRFSRDDGGRLKTDIGIGGAVIYLQDCKWVLDSTDIVLGHRHCSLDHFRFHSLEKSLSGDGVLSVSPDDTMKIRLDGLDISLINEFLADHINVSGTLTGTITASDIFNDPDILLDVDGSDVSFYGRPVGKLKMMSRRDTLRNRMNMLLTTVHGGESPINLTGFYGHDRKEVFLNASLHELSVIYAEPFLRDILKVDGGTLSGHLIFSGADGHYRLSGDDTRFDSLAFTPVFTGVPYVASGGIRFSEDGIFMEDVSITDRRGHKAAIEGGIVHDFLKDMALNLKMSFDDLELLDIPETPDAALYGTASASGAVSLTGPPDDILLDGTIRTGSNTSLHVPITNSYAASSNDILVFRNHAPVTVDPYDSMMTASAGIFKSKARIRVKADATVYNDATVTVELDKSLGNFVECHGNAGIKLDMDPSKALTDIRGYYNVTGGKARYTFAGIISREFSLNEGGSLTFRGPISRTMLDVGATYKTRTSISGLIADTSSVSSRQTVYASVGLSGGLDNPAFSFRIDIPDLDPLTKGRVETSLSTDAKVQQQFMALMLTGSFIRSEQSGVTDNSGILYSNVSEMLSNQVNNVMRSLNIPIDIGLNYQRTSSRRDIFDVNLSYQAFNNRLLLNGSVNNSGRYAGWGGNLEAELKMDKRGKFRFSLFTRAADQYTNFIDYSQRSGFGFSFQDEFNRFGEIFMSEKKKTSLELRRVEEAREALLHEQALREEKKDEKEERR